MGDPGSRPSVTVVSAVIVLVALAASLVAIRFAVDFEAATKQLAILWAVAISVIWFLGHSSAGNSALNITVTQLMAIAVLTIAWFIARQFGDTGLTCAAFVIGGVFLVGVARQALVTILGVSMGTIALLAVLVVGGIYYLSGR